MLNFRVPSRADNPHCCETEMVRRRANNRDFAATTTSTAAVTASQPVADRIESAPSVHLRPAERHPAEAHWLRRRRVGLLPHRRRARLVLGADREIKLVQRVRRAGGGAEPFWPE